MKSLNLDFLFYTHFGPRSAKNTLSQTAKEFELWMDIVKEGVGRNLTSNEILDILFQRRYGLLESNKNHGVHQSGTHLGTVEGMMGWIRRENEKH